MNASPPTPVIIGSVTLSIAAIAIAASTALPPRLRTSRPTSDASGWLLATIACWLRTTDRPGLTTRVWLLSWARGWMFVINISAIIAVVTQIRAIAVRDIGEPFQPAWSTTECQCLGRSVNARIVAHELPVLRARQEALSQRSRELP